MTTRRLLFIGLSTGIALGVFIPNSLFFGKTEVVMGQERSSFVGGVKESASDTVRAPEPVRNNIAQPSTPIVTKRYWKIKKGTFPQFLQASQEGVWPFFEKIGSRVIGMWMVVHPEGTDSEASPDYDEVFLMTQYASVDHWRATRGMAEMGGNGPDFEKCLEALATRRALTIETSLQFLQGSTWHNPPYYLPGLGETYELKK